MERGRAPPRSRPSGSDGSRRSATSRSCASSLCGGREEGSVHPGHASQAVLALHRGMRGARGRRYPRRSRSGRIKIVGLIVVGLFELVAALAALMLSAVGFVKALFGEDWSMPFLGEYREKVPGLHWQEGISFYLDRFCR